MKRIVTDIRAGQQNYAPRVNRALDRPNAEPMPWQRWRIKVLYSDFTDSDTSQSLNLADLADTLLESDPARVSGAFPTNMMMGFWAHYLAEEFAGGTINAATLIQGISGTTNGHLTITSVFTGAGTGWKQTPSGSLWTPRPVTSDPLLQLDTTAGNINTLSAGCVIVNGFFLLLPESEQV